MSFVTLANWNGEVLPLDEVKVSVMDRAFLFGDAIYEVIRIYHGVPFLFDDHISRLGRNLVKLSLNSDAEKIRKRVLDLLAQQPVTDGLVYIQVTRGQAKRTHHYPPADVTPNELVYISEFIDPYTTLRREGAKAILVDEFRWKRCDIKSVNLLANCMAAQAAVEADCLEAIFVDTDGTLIEGSHTSLFGVKDGAILTAPLGDHILPGITRKLLMELAEQAKIPVTEQSLHRDHLKSIDELFLTGTSLELMPIIQVDETRIGTGQVGPVVHRLLDAYAKRIGRKN